MFHEHECIARTLPDRQQAVIVHDHRPVLSEIAVETLALVEILGNSLIGVVADPLVEANCLLRDHAQAAFEPGNRHADISVNMHRAVHIRPRTQDTAMQREARPVDPGFFVEVLIH
jgi:hypothetical protein